MDSLGQNGSFARNQPSELVCSLAPLAVRVHPPPPQTDCMTYFVLGLLLLIFGVYFLRIAMKEKDKEGVIGLAAVLIAAMMLLLFYGLFFRVLF